MLPEHFNLEDQVSEAKLNRFVSELLGIEKFSPDPSRLDVHFSSFKKEFKDRNLPIIIVAGTNGKGEVTLLLERYCLDNGLYPMLWNSPHILSVRERMSFDGHPIDAETLLSLFERHRKLADQLSYYEFLFFCFCSHTKEVLDENVKIDPVLILEVGLGGRLDATNYFDSDLSILTSISRDHVEFLGSKLSGILKEKIAVSRSGKILVSAVEQNFLRPSIEQYCLINQVALIDLWSDESLCSDMDFHQRNQVCAEIAFRKFVEDVLHRNDAVRINPIEHVWGRPIKMTYSGTQFILLGSHNLDGLRHMAKWVSSQNVKLPGSSVQNCSEGSFYFDESWLSFSRQDLGDLKQCLSLISESPCIARKVFITSFDHPRATSWAALTGCAKSVMEDNIGKKVYLEQDFTTLIHRLDSEHGLSDDKRTTRRILVAGSYYFLGAFVASLIPDSYQFS